MIRNILSCIFLLCISFAAALAQKGNIDFIKNVRQFPEPVRYKANLPGGAVFLRTGGFTYSYYKEADLDRIHDLKHTGRNVYDEPVHFHAYHVSFDNARPDALMTESDIQPYYHNYFIGNDPSHWAGNVPICKQVTWHNIYEGIDATAYSREQSLKYDFTVQPGADPAQIVLAFDGVQPELQHDGSLRLHTTVNTITEQAPYVYQVINGKETAVACHYTRLPGNKIGFTFPQGYNKAYTLVIDPVLIFSTFSGSTAMTFGFSATYDQAGCLYAGGECFATGWPYTSGAFQTTFGSGVDAGINKYSTNGSTIVYATYYGGSGSDLPNNMMVNTNGELVICGSTSSTNLPVSIGCYDNTYGGGTGDIYIARFSASGAQLRAATYLGGSGTDGINTSTLSPNYGDMNRGEVLTGLNGSIYVAASTSSTNFPVTSGAVQTTNGGLQDAVICKLDSSLSVLQYSTYLGGSSNDAAFSLVMNSSNEIAVCGGTSSTNFPTTTGSLHTSNQGGTDGFASIINTTTGLSRSTYLGTASYDHAFKIQIDPMDDIFIMGQTASSSGYPVSPGVYALNNGDIFIHKLNPTLSATLLSTRLGNPGAGSGTFVPTAFMHDVCGNTYLSGFGAAGNVPVSTNAYQTTPGSFWLGALGPDFTSLLYATYFGPQGTHVDGGTSRFDPQGIIYHSACTNNGSFPTSPGVVHPVKLNGSWDIASYKFDMQVGGVVADFELANNANDTGCADYALTFHNLSFGATTYHWEFGDGATSDQVNPSHTFAEGSHTITLIASRTNGCNLSDTASMVIFVKHTDKPLLQLNDTFICDPVPIQLSAQVSNLTTAMSFHWEPATAITSNPNLQQVMVNPAASTTYTVYVGNAATGECVDTAIGLIHISLFDYSLMTAQPLDTLICPGDTITIRAYGGSSFVWSPQQDISNINSATPRVWPGSNFSYTVLITNDSACQVERTVNIHMLPHPHVEAGLDQDIKRGESTNLQALATGSILWTPAGSVSPDNIANPAVAPDQTTTYYLTIRSAEGCVAMDSVTIHVTNAMLPNAFSPNGDGHNDVFRLSVQDERVHLKDFSVYNRYGQRVFYTKDIAQGWDGSFNGKPSDLSTYFYLVNYIIGANTYTLKGDVTLIR